MGKVSNSIESARGWASHLSTNNQHADVTMRQTNKEIVAAGGYDHCRREARDKDRILAIVLSLDWNIIHICLRSELNMLQDSAETRNTSNNGNR
jgi:hypothetical protein